ncbi:cupin domain-containing protein [Bordetella genomosp. 13]|uniref:cupin domain-containing protein n=1 Tax=Bordetella genomosp. 13 TaxID=463040 RepID=UPI0021B59BED|nr:cupin domain-containing protein [Bordetella genomosp. 13]
MTLSARAKELAQRLRLEPHPEGGMYREVFRSGLTVLRQPDGEARGALTSIFFLLPQGACSRWHRVDADEAWHHYEGAPIDLMVLLPGASQVITWKLGMADADALPVRVVPAGAWQAARPAGEYALAGCTVGPGFEFRDFTLAADLPPHQCPAALKQAPYDALL